MDKANLYASPPSSAYMVMKPFTMPISNGSIWAISFTAKNGTIVSNSLSLIYTFIFTWLWTLVVAATIYFAPHHFSRRRLIALVALRNTSSPLSALQALANFTTESMGCFGPRKLRQASTWRDTLFGLLFATLCFIVIVGSATMGIFGAAFLRVGSVAPVKADAVFYPKADAENMPREMHRALRRDPSLRALSSVQVFSDTIGPDVVQVEEDENITASGTPEQPMFGLNYRYKLTGAELGLKDASDLALTVNGACRTEYGWLATNIFGPELDSYTFFGDPKNNLSIDLSGPYRSFQPRATFKLPRDLAIRWDQAKLGNLSYAVMLTSALRNSTSEGTDPWYLTESQPGPEYTYRIRRGRPVLSCWQQDTWRCGGKSVNGALNLVDLGPALKMPEVLQNVFGIAFLTPPIQRLGEDAGNSALASITYSLDSKMGILDAQQSSIYQDMKRLILASYIGTLNILGDTTRYRPTEKIFKEANWFYNVNNSAPEEGADGFVVFTPEVATFNLTGLIAAASVATLLLAMKIALTLKLLFHRNIYAALHDVDDIDPHLSMSPINKDRWARFRAFSAIHLLRNTYEDGSGVPAKDWRCGDGLPEPREDKPLLLVRCKRGDSSCAGHIATQPSLLDEARELKQQRRRRRSKLNSVSSLLGEAEGPYGQSAGGRADKRQSGITVTSYSGCSSSAGTTPGENGPWLPNTQANTGAILDSNTNYFAYAQHHAASFPPGSTADRPVMTRLYQDDITNTAPYSAQYYR